MKILLVAATENEIKLLRESGYTGKSVEFLVTGIGMTATAWSMTKYFSKSRPELAINCGIAGSFRRDIPIGQMVRITEDNLAELGAEDGDDFLNLGQMGLEGETQFSESFDSAVLNTIRKVKSITVNTVHGNEKSITAIVKRLNPDVESMEGAAFFQVCKMEAIPCLQLRTISNYIEKRNKENWNIPLALNNLSNQLITILKNL